jgi:nitrate/nitrite-specific signal transduction histidine kinase
MRERAALIGAKLEIATTAGGGCEVKLAVRLGQGTATT